MKQKYPDQEWLHEHIGRIIWTGCDIGKDGKIEISIKYTNKIKDMKTT